MRSYSSPLLSKCAVEFMKKKMQNDQHLPVLFFFFQPKHLILLHLSTSFPDSDRFSGKLHNIRLNVVNRPLRLQTNPPPSRPSAYQRG